MCANARRRGIDAEPAPREKESCTPHRTAAGLVAFHWREAGMRVSSVVVVNFRPTQIRAIGLVAAALFLGEFE